MDTKPTQEIIESFINERIRKMFHSQAVYPTTINDLCSVNVIDSGFEIPNPATFYDGATVALSVARFIDASLSINSMSYQLRKEIKDKLNV